MTGLPRNFCRVLEISRLTGVILILVHRAYSENSTEDLTTVPPLPFQPDSGKEVNLSSTSRPPVKLKNNTVKAWSVPLSHFLEPAPPESYSIYSAEMLTKLVRRYHELSSTNDPLNEVYYTRKRIGDNVWFNVERVAPFTMYMNWAVVTSKIMDRLDGKGNPLINQYIQNDNGNVSCAPESSFQVIDSVIMEDDKRARLPLNSVMKSWARKTRDISPTEICNKFRGLTCNPKSKMCECESNGNTTHYVSYKRTEQDKPGEYRDGCYVKPWKKCSHLSMDSNIPAEYKSYHAHPNNMKQFLLRLATPLPRMARCEKGSYCVDMILNKKRPICWCSSRMHSKECFNSVPAVPLLRQFLQIRRQFHQMIIPERDKRSKCNLDEIIVQKLLEIKYLSDDVQSNYFQILRKMKEVIGKGGRICDFRKGLACDPFRKICSYRTGCGPGRVLAEGPTIGRQCQVNNGYPCPTVEMECVSGALCKDFGMGRHCHCDVGTYGDMCRFQEPAFFSSILQSRISGFVGFHFSNLQELVNHVLAPIERLMTLGYHDKCNSNLDSYAISIVRHLGGVRFLNLDQMDETILAVQYLVGQNERLCNYRRFLGCTTRSLCEPMMPDVMQYEVVPAPELPGGIKVYLSLRPMARCSSPGNYSNIPPIFRDVIHVQCLQFHECRKVEGKVNSYHRYCMCPIGYQGARCDELPMKNVRVYEIAEPMLAKTVAMDMDTMGDNMESHLDIIHAV